MLPRLHNEAGRLTISKPDYTRKMKVILNNVLKLAKPPLKRIRQFRQKSNIHETVRSEEEQNSRCSSHQADTTHKNNNPRVVLIEQYPFLMFDSPNDAISESLANLLKPL